MAAVLAWAGAWCGLVRAETGYRWESVGTAESGARAVVALPGGKVLAARTVGRGGRAVLVVAGSADVGRTWAEVGQVAEDVAGTDLGDSHLLRLRSGKLMCSYRRNHVERERPTYAIEVAESADEGRTWTRHSVVARSEPETGRRPSRGLWSSFVLERGDGVLQCYYDDEETPFREGFPSHQWLTMRTWDEGKREWVDPVVVSRAHDAKHLSRDGMPSVIEFEGGRLLAVYESVRVERPHANVVRYVTSEDGGRTWSWQNRERGIVYGPRGEYMALSPWAIRLGDGRVLCVFCTDEDREKPDVSGTPPHRLNMDIKCVVSGDGGRTWSARGETVHAGGHRNYLPGAVEVPTSGEVIVQFVDFTAKGYRTVRGVPAR